MDCCASREGSLSSPRAAEKDQRLQQVHRRSSSFNGSSAVGFAEFALVELKSATNNFSSENIVSESGEKAPNVVYQGRLQNNRWISIRKFTKMPWPDPKQFSEEAKEVGKLRHERLANLIGYCCDGDERCTWRNLCLMRLLLSIYSTVKQALYACTRKHALASNWS